MNKNKAFRIHLEEYEMSVPFNDDKEDSGYVIVTKRLKKVGEFLVDGDHLEGEKLLNALQQYSENYAQTADYRQKAQKRGKHQPFSSTDVAKSEVVDELFSAVEEPNQGKLQNMLSSLTTLVKSTKAGVL